MPRVKRGVTANHRRKRLLKYTKGFRWGRKSKFALAKEAVIHAWKYAYRDRRNKKRVFRALWQTHINAACREQGLQYSRFIHMLKEKNIVIDRKIMSQLIQDQPEAFKKIIEQATYKK
jgi:large subunit ribosomal protein L20